MFYDVLGRVTGYTTEEETVNYTYDASGNVLTVKDKTGKATREYDACNRMLSYTDTYGQVVRYEYDAVGNLTRIRYPDHLGSVVAVCYTYDQNRNLLTVTDWENRVTSYTYDESNRVTRVTKPDGSETVTEYDDKMEDAEEVLCLVDANGFLDVWGCITDDDRTINLTPYIKKTTKEVRYSLVSPTYKHRMIFCLTAKGAPEGENYEAVPFYLNGKAVWFVLEQITPFETNTGLRAPFCRSAFTTA